MRHKHHRRPDYETLKDRARMRKEIQRRPWAVPEALFLIYGAEGCRGDTAPTAQVFRNLHKLRRRGPHLDQAMLKHLVGRGYLEPDGKEWRAGSYRLTRRGANTMHEWLLTMPVEVRFQYGLV